MKQEMNTETEESAEPIGIDSIIARVDSYIADTKLVTPGTLAELKSELEDLKEYLDGEETQEPKSMGGDNKESGSDPKEPALAIMIGKMKHGGEQ